MKKVLYLLLILPMLVFGQTAEEIIQSHFENNGGYKQWNNLNSIYIEGQVIMGVNSSVPIIIEHKRPYFKRVSFSMEDGERLSEGYDGEKGYTYDEITGNNKIIIGYTPDAFESDILNFKNKGFKAKLIGEESIDGVDTYHIELTKNTVKSDFWFRKSDSQLVQSYENDELIKYSDFKNFNGLTFACKMLNLPKGGLEYTVLFNHIVPNKKIDNNRFIFK